MRIRLGAWAAGIAGMVGAMSAQAQEAPPADAPPADASATVTADVPAEAPAPEVPAEAAPAVGIGIEEIIVTAQKRSEKIDDVPIAISAFGGETLNQLGVTDTRDLQRLVPGFNANESGRGSTLYTMRGVGFADTTYTATNTVGTYIDEVNLPYSVMTRGANLDIQRVEVLKGPQGTLYGRNTTGGLINYIANTPTDTFQAGTITSFSRFETLESENFISGPLLDSLRGRLAFKIVDSNKGWQYSQLRPGDRLGKQEKLSGRASLDWQPADTVQVILRAEGWSDESDPQAPQAVGIIPGNPFIGALGLHPEIRTYPLLTDADDPRVADWPDTEVFPGKLDDSFHMESVKGIWNISDTMSFTAIGSHLETKTKGSPQLQGFHITETDLITTAQIKTNAFEARLADRWFEERFSIMVGINVSKDEAKEDELADTTHAGALFAIGNLPVTNPDTGEEIPAVTSLVDLYGEPTKKQRAIFLNTDTVLTDTLSLNAGVRYTKNKEHYYFCASEPVEAVGLVGLSNVFTGLSAQAALTYAATHPGEVGRPSVVTKGECFSLGEDGNNDPFEDNLNQENTSGRVALSFQPVDDQLYYASVSRGFKAGGFPVLNPARKSQLVPVVQEELLAYELGTKLSFFDRRFHTNLTGFYYDYTDKQLLTKTLDPVFGPLPILQNAPESHVYGVEVDFQVIPAEGLFVAFAGSYIKTKIDEFVGTNSEGDEQDFAGLPFNFAPEWQLSATADYTRPLNWANLELGGGADVYYTDDTYGAIDQNPLLYMDEYTLIGARIHIGPTTKKWTTTVFCRNLTNELANLGTNSWSEAVTRSVARPRTWGVTFQYTWE